MFDKWNALQHRIQERDEHVMDYYQDKINLCQALLLPFDEVKDHVAQRIYYNVQRCTGKTPHR